MPTSKKILYTNGDSFVFGMEAIGDKNRNIENKKYSFANIAADYLGYTCINNSYNSATNEFIFRKTLIDLENLEKTGTDPADVLVLIGTTALHREEIVTKYMFEYIGAGKHFTMSSENREFHDYGTLFISPSHSHNMKVIQNGIIRNIDIAEPVVDFCSMYFWDDDYQQEKFEIGILALESYLKLKGYRYLFVNCCSTLQTGKLINFKSVNFFRFDQSFFEWGKLNYPNNIRLQNHFDPIPHKKYAELIVDYLGQNKL
jgi:hypothetical protein